MRVLARLPRVPDLTRIPSAPLLAAGMVGGFALAQQTQVRPLGGAAMLGANVAAAPKWYAVGGAPLVAGLTTAYWTAMGVSHPLARKVGTWPSVLGAAAVAAGAAWVLADRRTAR
jgi:hypothetical protein